jgi:intracellular multiplication protein IcmO
MSSGKQGGGNDDMWTGRAINFVESLMKVLTAMRDAGFILLDANSIRDYFILEKLEQIVVDKRFPITDTYSVPLDAYPPQVLEPLTAYILNLPGYNRQKKGNQGSEVREQHGFITMQLTRAFGSLADTYGHIIRTNLAEVDFKDVVLNRRILVVLLPALEKSPQELSNLGKIIVASLKAMMAAGLGEEVEGDYRDVVLRKPTNSPTPFICIMDEYGYYAVEGFAVVPAQARSLGFSAIFAGQDLPAFQKASKEEAASIGANCNIKICMKLEDPQETWEFFNKVAGEAYVTSVSGFQMDATSMTMNYMDTRNASVDKRQRIDVLDLKDQRPGEAHVFFKSKIVRAEMFYAAPKPVKRLCVNQFLKVEPPNEEQLTAMGKRLKRFKEILNQPHYEMPDPMMSTDINTMAQTLQGAINLKPFERGIAALISLLEQEVQKQRDLSVPFEEPGVEGEMSAFTKIFITPLVHQIIGDENVELFTLPLIRRGSTTEEMKHIQRLLGASEQDALKQAESVIRDIETATRFPPAVDHTVDPDTLVQDISDLIQQIGGEALDLHGLQDQVARAAATAEEAQHEEFEFSDFPDFPDLSHMDFEEDEDEGEEDEDESGGSESGDEESTSASLTEDQHEETAYADYTEAESDEALETAEEEPEPTWDTVRDEIARKEQEAKASGNEFPDLDLSNFEYEHEDAHELPEEHEHDPLQHPIEHPESTDVVQEQKEKTEAEKEKDKPDHSAADQPKEENDQSD